MQKKLIVPAIVIAALVFLSSIVWFKWNIETKQRLQAAKQALIDEGAPMSLGEMLADPISEDENAAIILKPLLTLMEDNEWSRAYSSISVTAFDEKDGILIVWNDLSDEVQASIQDLLAMETSQIVIDGLHQSRL